MHIDAAVFRNMKAEAVFFSRNRDISQLFRKRSRKSRKPCKHFGFRILCFKKMIQGTEWIVQADGFFAKTQFCLFFFNNINQIFSSLSKYIHILHICIHVNHTTIIGIAQAHYKQNKIKEYIRKQNPTAPRQSAVRCIRLLLFENARQFPESAKHRPSLSVSGT